MNLILFDPPDTRKSLLPFTFTRPVAEIRVGILTISEKWEKRWGQEVSYCTEDYLREAFPLNTGKQNVMVNGCVCPTESLIQALKGLKTGARLEKDGITIGFCTDDNSPESILESGDYQNMDSVLYEDDLVLIDKLWKIYIENADQIKKDFEMITRGRISAPVTDPHTIVYGKEDIFLEEGATTKASILNAEKGPIYLGKNSLVSEGAVIKGSFALCEESIVNMGAKIRGDATVGPYSKVGGEYSNSVIFGYSNNLHDGFMGNSVLGEWCNIGADTNTSNLKNNYTNIKMWSYLENGFVNTGQQFCGLFMGDHSRCGINMMFNTGTVVGVGANIFGSDFPRNMIPSFSWGGHQGFTTFKLPKLFETADIMMSRRGKSLTETDKKILQRVFEDTVEYRHWER